MAVARVQAGSCRLAFVPVARTTEATFILRTLCANDIASVSLYKSRWVHVMQPHSNNAMLQPLLCLQWARQ